MFIADRLDAAAGVRQPLEDYAKDHPEMRVMAGHFQEIQQAMGTPKRGDAGQAGVAYLKAFVEEMKASGFVADALKRSDQVAQGRARGEVGQPQSLDFQSTSAPSNAAKPTAAPIVEPQTR